MKKGLLKSIIEEYNSGEVNITKDKKYKFVDIIPRKFHKTVDSLLKNVDLNDLKIEKKYEKRKSEK